MPVIESDINQCTRQCKPLSLSTTQFPYWPPKKIDFQSGNNLLHLHLEIPCLQGIHAIEEFRQRSLILLFHGIFISTYQLYHGVVGMKKLVTDQTLFIENRVLLEQGHRQVFVNEQFSLIRRFLTAQNAQ